MTAKTGTEKSRISRERAKLGLVQLIAWVPAAKLKACQDAIDQIISKPNGKWIKDAEIHPMTNMWHRKWRVTHLDGSITNGTYVDPAILPRDRFLLEWWFETKGDTNDA